MELIVYIIVAIIVGGAIGWLLANTKGNAILQTEKENLGLIIYTTGVEFLFYNKV